MGVQLPKPMEEARKDPGKKAEAPKKQWGTAPYRALEGGPAAAGLPFFQIEEE